jgi:hypothetical protein
VLFKGLFIIDPNNNDGSCTVGMHRGTDDHFLIIEVRATRPNGSDVLVMRRAGLLQNTLTISTNPPSPAPRVSAFRPGANFDRQNCTEVRDLRWAIDLLHLKEFHGPNSLTMNMQAATPGILMNDGIFITSDITDESEVKLRRTRGGDGVPLHRIATIISALIPQPTATGVVVLDWGGGELLQLPRPEGTGTGQDPAGTYYRISVRNEPVAIDCIQTHDELERYYDLVKKSDGGLVLGYEQFRLEVQLQGKEFGRRNTDRIPCMPILLEG